MKRQILSLGVVMAFLCPAGLQAKIAYNVIDLGTLPGMPASEAWSINDAGQIVGEVDDSKGLQRATLFDPAGPGKNIDLGTLGGNWSRALSINGTGQIVGQATNKQGDGCATLFDPTGAGKNIDLGTLGAGTSAAWCINDAGQIVGSEKNSQGYSRATLFDPRGAGNNLNLGTLGGYQYSSARSINDAGQIVGWADNKWWRDGRAILFDPTGAGNNIDLGTFGGVRSSAYCINGAGQIVGSAQKSDYAYRATLFDPTGNNIDLGTLAGYQDSWANSINDAGQIVGWAGNDEMGDYFATLFDPTGAGNNIDLNTLIDPASGWTLTRANDINNSGWIVGDGINPQGESHAFLLVPKPPCLYALAGDLNDDCKVDFADFAVMAANWLVDCGAVPTDPACVPK